MDSCKEFLSSILIRSFTQRVRNANLCIEGISQGQFEQGLVVLCAFGQSIKQKNLVLIDWTPERIQFILKNLRPILEKLTDKLLNLRIFSDSDGKFNFSLKDISGGIYLVSQFTLFADCRAGNRPSFTNSLKAEIAKPIYEEFLSILKKNSDKITVFSGVFASNMQLSFCNDGPVSILLDANFKGLI